MIAKVDRNQVFFTDDEAPNSVHIKSNAVLFGQSIGGSHLPRAIDIFEATAVRVCLDSQKLSRAIQVRGLHLTDLARLSGLTLPTVSAAAAGRRVNITTALALTRALNSQPIIPELEALVGPPLDPPSTANRTAPPALSE